jgi:dCTP deaminase
MSLLAHNELLELVASGVITNTPESRVNPASIDVTLGKQIMTERIPRPGSMVKPIDLANGDHLPMDQFNMTGYGGEAYYDLHPGEFILACTEQIFHLPNHMSAEYMLKSTLARSALEHLAARWCDAGWHGSALTLELKNMSRYHTLRLRPGMGIGQMKFYSHAIVPAHASYAATGQYNEDGEGAQPGKVLR